MAEKKEESRVMSALWFSRTIGMLLSFLQIGRLNSIIMSHDALSAVCCRFNRAVMFDDQCKLRAKVINDRCRWREGWVKNLEHPLGPEKCTNRQPRWLYTGIATQQLLVFHPRSPRPFFAAIVYLHHLAGTATKLLIKGMAEKNFN